MKNLFLMTALIAVVGCGKKVNTIVGAPGNDGESCYTETIETGTNIICGDSVSFVPNGVDGKDGTDGEDGVDGEDGTFDGYLEYRIICEDIPGNYQETLVYLDGKYLAFLDGGRNDRLALLKEGVRYRTTDGRKVNFTILEGEITCL